MRGGLLSAHAWEVHGGLDLLMDLENTSDLKNFFFSYYYLYDGDASLISSFHYKIGYNKKKRASLVGDNLLNARLKVHNEKLRMLARMKCILSFLYDRQKSLLAMS